MAARMPFTSSSHLQQDTLRDSRRCCAGRTPYARHVVAAKARAGWVVDKEVVFKFLPPGRRRPKTHNLPTVDQVSISCARGEDEQLQSRQDLIVQVRPQDAADRELAIVVVSSCIRQAPIRASAALLGAARCCFLLAATVLALSIPLADFDLQRRRSSRTRWSTAMVKSDPTTGGKIRPDPVGENAEEEAQEEMEGEEENRDEEAGEDEKGKRQRRSVPVLTGLHVP
ncbi:BZ3500_MvSof-1268-A1-R1_Chr3-1g05937 [Microbotryum saponariae]|uniref:BZ3500_MvSof-1268-A1-R1_Chr3-1g05937 protein n=1 Tax=Microbotryum saponariae TaxID=289078 RepID=A0A2X0N3T8_9BASI|nr:BZ3500_MvSof-1268-A1-R1_Chr3-1g05937 [Microbotryum saponariae]SDA05127.1 BZ3501_MvSof-1269-A2-R1_Chr3-1g05607 [Microbotryum saponariae]